MRNKKGRYPKGKKGGRKRLNPTGAFSPSALISLRAVQLMQFGTVGTAIMDAFGVTMEDLLKPKEKSEEEKKEK